MSGLLEKAIPIHDQFYEIESIPLSEREQVFEDIDRAINRGKLKITEDTFQFSPLKKGRKFPILVNLSSLAVLLGIGTFLIIYFSLSEKEIISGSSSINLTESQIITALKKESEKQLSEKETEIAKIQTEMETLLSKKDLLLIESENERARLEQALTEKLENQLSLEEERLRELNLNQEAIDERLNALKLRLENDYARELQNSLAAEQEKRQQRERELEEEIIRIEESLNQAQQEKETLSADLNEQQKAQDSAEKEYEILAKTLENEQFLGSQINASFDNITTELLSGNYPEAAEEIKTLSSFIRTEDFSGYPNLLARRKTDSQILETLNQLIPREPPIETVPAPPPVLNEIAALIEEGTRLYNNKQYSDAKETVLKALSLIPDLESGYRMIQAMEELSRKQRMTAFEEEVKKGNTAFLAGKDLSAQENYFNALKISGFQSEVLRGIINNLKLMGTRAAMAEVENNIVSDEDMLFLEYARVDYQNRMKLMNIIRNLGIVMDEIQEGLPYASNEEDMLELLEKKVLLKEILASQMVRKQYPDVYKSLEEYLDTYGIIQESIGKTHALKETASMLNALLKETSYLPSPDDPEQKDLYQEILSDLIRMVEPIYHEE